MLYIFSFKIRKEISISVIYGVPKAGRYHMIYDLIGQHSTWNICIVKFALQWRHNDHDGIPNHQPHDCLLNCLFRSRSKLHVTGLFEGNSPVTGEFPAQMASNAEYVSIWWHHHDWYLESSPKWHNSYYITCPMVVYFTCRGNPLHNLTSQTAI